MSPAPSASSRFHPAPRSIAPFSLSAVLPTMSINNSMIILPGWPHEWQERSRSSRSGFIGRDQLSVDDEEAEDPLLSQTDIDDEAMDLDETEESLVPSPASSFATYPNTVPFLHPPRIPHLSSSTPQSLETASSSRRSTSFSSNTHPRSVRQSFSSNIERPGHPPIQIVSSLPSRSPSLFGSDSVRRASMTSARSAASSKPRSRHEIDLEEPRLLISNNDQTVKMFSLPRITKTNYQSSSSRRDSSSSVLPGPYVPASLDPAMTPITSAMRRTVSGSQGGRATPNEAMYIHLPRMQTPAVPLNIPQLLPRQLRDPGAGNTARQRQPFDNAQLQREISQARAQLRSESDASRWQRDRDEFERTVGMSVGRGTHEPSGGLGLRTGVSGSQSLLEDWRSMTQGALSQKQENREERKLAKIGGARFKYAVNHCEHLLRLPTRYQRLRMDSASLSPDLKTMVSVGDSSDVYIFEVIDGGREFKRIGVYTGKYDQLLHIRVADNLAQRPLMRASRLHGTKTDGSLPLQVKVCAPTSLCLSKSDTGADGQVTIWDHRSSHPMAIFHTSSDHRPISPTTSPNAQNRRAPSSSSDIDIDAAYEVHAPNVVLIDPVTGAARSGGSTSGKEAARVVKFSPEGSARDLMVFSEVRPNQPRMNNG